MKRGTRAALLALAASATLGACEKVTLPPDLDGKVPDSKVADSKVGDLTRRDARLDGPAPAKGWAISAGGPGFDAAYALVADNVGNVFVAGTFTGTATFGNTTLTATGANQGGVYVAKLDSNGAFVWAVGLPGVVAEDSVTGIALDSAGNIFIAASFMGTAVFSTATLTAKGDQDVFLAKLSPTGQVLWAVGMGGPAHDYVSDRLTIDSSGNITISGTFSGTATFGSTTLTAAGLSDAFFVQLDGNGKVLSAVQVGSDDTLYSQILGLEEGGGVAADGAGNTFISGEFFGTATVGSFTVTAPAKWNGRTTFIAKRDPAGKFLWATAYPGADYWATDLVLDGSGNSYLAGTIQNLGPKYAALVAKVDASGTFVWQTTAPGADTSSGAWTTSVAVDAAGSTTAVGYFQGTTTFGKTTLTSAGDTDIFVAKLDASGAFVSAERAGAVGLDRPFAVRTCGTDLCIAGIFASGTITLAGTTLTSRGVTDMFIWRRPSL